MKPDQARNINEAIDAAGDELTRLVQEAVRRPSLPDREQEVQDFLAQHMRLIGLEVDVVTTRYEELCQHPAFTDDGFSPDKRINLVGTWKGTNTGEGKSLILNGHIDVVSPGDPNMWSDSPWSGSLVDGKLYGRGSCDMKAGICSGIFAVEMLKRLGFQPIRDIFIETVVGEESGGVGTLTTIVKGYTADGVIILEPTRLGICPVASGALTFRLTVPGKAIHAAMKAQGISALEKFIVLQKAINELEVQRHAAFKHVLYEDPHAIAPINIGTIRGGEWHSTVPEEVVAEGRYGVFPGETNEAARLALEAAVRTAALADPWLREHPPRLEWFEGQFESGETKVDEPVVQHLIQAHKNVTHQEPEIYGVPYGSDLRLFTNHAHIPGVHYGPGDVNLAHSANEYVPLNEVLTSAKVIAQMIVDWCGGSFEE